VGQAKGAKILLRASLLFNHICQDQQSQTTGYADRPANSFGRRAKPFCNPAESFCPMLFGPDSKAKLSEQAENRSLARERAKWAKTPPISRPPPPLMT